MLNLIQFNNTDNFIYGLIIVLIILAMVYKSYGMYKETSQKRFVFFGAMFLISGLLELLHILLIFDNTYLEFLNVFLNRLYQCIGLLGIIFIKDNPPKAKVSIKDFSVYFGSFLIILITEYGIVHFNLAKGIFPNLLNSSTTFLFISILSAFVITKTLNKESPFNKFNIGLLFLSFSGLYIIGPIYYISSYRHLIHIFRVLGNLLLLLGINTIKENFQEYRLRLKLILLPNLYMIIFFILFVALSNLLFNFNFSNEIYASFILFYILYLGTQSVFIARSTSSITQITQKLKQFDPNKEPILINIYGNDEIGILAENINKVSETQWKYTQELKEKQAQIQDLMNSRDSFIAALSHDLKSPLFSEQKFIESILLDKDNIKVADFIESLEDMYKINDEVLRIVNNLLTAYYLDSQTLKLNCEETDINHIVESAENTLKHLAKDANIVLALNLMADIPLICVDKDMLSRVVTNLISNAIKHSKSSGKIDISTTNIEGSIQVSIQDYGRGIPEDEKPNIFQKYPSSKRTVGTGLGLYISKQIVDAHNGKIWFESEAGKGTVFNFIIPSKQ